MILHSSHCLLLGDKWFFFVPLLDHVIQVLSARLLYHEVTLFHFAIRRCWGEVLWNCINIPFLSNFVDSFNSLCLCGIVVSYLMQWVIAGYCPHFWCSDCSDLASETSFEMVSVSFCHAPILLWALSCLRPTWPSPGISHYSKEHPHLWLGSNSSFWVSEPRFPSGCPPYSTQALIVPARQTSSFLGGYLTLDHANSRMPSDSAPTLTLCVGHRSHLGFVPHCGPPQLGGPLLWISTLLCLA